MIYIIICLKLKKVGLNSNFALICREAFKIFDRNKDGMITLKELKKVTDILGTVLSKEEVDEFMKEADKV